MKFQIPTFILIALLFPPGIIAAQVTTSRDMFGDPVINISGAIVKGDLAKIKKVSAALITSLPDYATTALHFHLNTPGGDIEEAMKIGRFARDVLASVDSYGNIIVAPGPKSDAFRDNPDYVFLPANVSLTEKSIVRNYSAGILIFYGAVKRSHRDNSDQRLGDYKARDIPVMGLHRPYFEKEAFATLTPSKAAQAYQNLEKAVRAYLAEMGAPQDLVDRMFKSASTDIDLIPDDEFRHYYKSEESFMEEWLIAKCGATGEQNILSNAELTDFRTMMLDQVRARNADTDNPKQTLDDILYLYPSEHFPQDYVEELYRKVRTHNVKVNGCRASAISIHQKEWARNVR